MACDLGQALRTIGRVGMAGMGQKAGKAQVLGGGNPGAQVERCRIVRLEPDTAETDIDLEEHADFGAVTRGGRR
ncbi:hypothetical protein D3C87_1941240 [compost metagenome]